VSNSQGLLAKLSVILICISMEGCLRDLVRAAEERSYKLSIQRIQELRMSKPVQIFTAAAIARIRQMKRDGASAKDMADAIGSKSANAFQARCSQLGVFRQKPNEAAAA
jgi:hypothetical protein